jgi:CBS domain-containing protein
MKVRDLMHKGVEIMPPETSITKLAKKMRELDVGAIPIGSDGALVGMVTDRDITVRAVANGKDISHLTAHDVMTKGVFCCRDTARVKDVVHMMEENKIRRVPVTDESERIVGIVTLGDISAPGRTTRKVMQAVSAHHA